MKKSKEEKQNKIKTQITCPHCGKSHEAEVEIPESTETPKMTWEA